MSNLLKNLIIVLCITVILGIVYYFTIGGSDEFEDATTTTDFNSDIAVRTQKILADTQIINDYKLDISIFDDARFRALSDFRVDIIDVPTGRENPFEPVQ